jgi:hypothetical protein
MSSITGVALAASLAALAEAGPPPPITWGSATTVSGDSDVSTSGTLLYAYNVGASGVSSATVNTVTFASYVFPSAPAQTVTVGSVTFTESPGYLWGSNSLGSSSAPFSNLSSGYKTLLGSAGGADNPVTITATLGGLTVGNQYQLQIWTSNPSNASNPYGTIIGDTTFTAGNSVTLDPNTTNASGGLGQYVIGTFTADGVSRTFTMNSSGFNAPSLSAFQVRDVTPIPGPGGAAVVALFGTALARRRRTR